jgi:hypothetical protein
MTTKTDKTISNIFSGIVNDNQDKKEDKSKVLKKTIW